MPLINSPLPRASHPKFYQGSSLRSVRDPERPDRYWSRHNVTSISLDAVLQELAKIKQDFGRLRRRVLGGGATSGTSGMDFAGEYDPTQQYKAKTIVIFTPEGGAAGTYISNQITQGVSPDVGYPNWTALPNSPPGMWG